MLTGAPFELEVRRDRSGETRLRGVFNYNTRAVLSDGGRTGRPRKEEFAPGAFDYSIDSPDQDILLLVGHSFDRPLASKFNESLTFERTAKSLILNAVIPAMVANTTHGRDALALLGSGLAVGFRRAFAFRLNKPCRMQKKSLKKTRQRDAPLSGVSNKPFFMNSQSSQSPLTRMRPLNKETGNCRKPKSNTIL